MMTGNTYTVSIRTPGNSRQAGSTSDLAAARRRKGARQKRRSSSAPASPAPPRITAPARIVRSEPSKSIPTAISRSTATPSRWATASARRSPTGSPAHLGGIADEVTVAQVDVFDALDLVTSGDSYTITQAEQDAAATRSALGAGDQYRHQRLDRRPCRDAGRGGGGARRVPLRPVAGGARPVGHRGDRSARRTVGKRRAGRTGNSIMPGLAPLALPAIAAARACPATA